MEYTVISNDTVCMVNIGGMGDVVWGVVNGCDMVRAVSSNVACVV